MAAGLASRRTIAIDRPSGEDRRRPAQPCNFYPQAKIRGSEFDEDSVFV
jgi:hypothetical protein